MEGREGGEGMEGRTRELTILLTKEQVGRITEPAIHRACKKLAQPGEGNKLRGRRGKKGYEILHKVHE